MGKENVAGSAHVTPSMTNLRDEVMISKPPAGDLDESDMIERQPLMLQLEGLDYERIAGLLGISAENIGVRVYRERSRQGHVARGRGRRVSVGQRRRVL